MKGVYLCARSHRIPGFDIDYNDIVDYPGINLLCDCRDVDISKYDFLIATPPCNYYSRANWRRESSQVALMTKELLPYCLNLFKRSSKPFLIENVMNKSLLPHDQTIIEFDFGQHHFYTNVFFLIPHKTCAVRQNKQYISRNARDNNYNVHLIIDLFLYTISQLLPVHSS